MELITKSEFAKRVGISKAAISQAIRPGGPLAGAVIQKKINIDSDCVAIYAARHSVDISTPKVTFEDPPPAEPRISPPNSTGTISINNDTNVEDFENMTLDQLCGIFGTDERFKTWLTARKIITDIRVKEIAIAVDLGELISRELVKNGVMDPIDAAHIKLMTDGAKTISRRAIAMHDAGRPLEEIEVFTKKQITSFIRPLKSKIKRALADV